MEIRQYEELKLRQIPEERKDFIRLARMQDEDIDGQLDILLDDFHDTYDKNVKNNKVQDFDSISLSLPIIFSSFFLFYTPTIVDYNTRTASIQSEALKDQINGKFGTSSRYVPQLRIFNSRADSYPSKVERTILSRTNVISKIPVGTRIKTLNTQSVNIVRSILTVGIRQGQSANEIAYNIDQYIKPAPEGKRVSPFTWIRDMFGTPKVTAIEKGLVPAGPFSYNAFRIARTEINNTYRVATVEMTKNLSFVKGYRWNLSPTHPRTDICDDYAKGSPYKSHEVPTSHPNCYCYVTTELID